MRACFSFIAELGKAQHEFELQETTLRREIEMLKEQLTEMEQECQVAIKNQKLGFEEDLARLKREKVSGTGSQSGSNSTCR